MGPLRYHLALAFYRLQSDRPVAGPETQTAQRYAVKKLKLLETAESAAIALAPAVALLESVRNAGPKVAPRTEPFTRAILAAANLASKTA